MKKVIVFLSLITILVVSVVVPQASAQVADGTHSISYQVNQPNSSSASIANDYFVKPAKVTVDNGTATVQITLKNSAWITKFQPTGGATVVSEDKGADTRVVQFQVKDLSQPLNASMKIDIDDIDYHHEYTVTLVFDAASQGGATAGEGNSEKTPTSATGTGEKEPNPQTSDTMPYLIILTLLGSAFLLFKTKQRTKQEG